MRARVCASEIGRATPGWRWKKRGRCGIFVADSRETKDGWRDGEMESCGAARTTVDERLQTNLGQLCWQNDNTAMACEAKTEEDKEVMKVCWSVLHG